MICCWVGCTWQLHFHERRLARGPSGKKSGAPSVAPKNQHTVKFFPCNHKQYNKISKHKDLLALGRRQPPPQGCNPPQQFRLNPRRRFHAFRVWLRSRHPESAQEDAVAIATEGVKGPRVRIKSLCGYATGSRFPFFLAASVCLRPRQRDRGTCISFCVCVLGGVCVCVGVCVCGRVCSNVPCHHTRNQMRKMKS